VENRRVLTLKKSSDFLYLSKQGIKLRLAAWLTLQYTEGDPDKLLVGVTASRKVGSAVIRNKLKRWVKLSVRSAQFKEEFYGKKVVFVFRPKDKEFYKKLKYQDFFNKFETAKVS
jgi:ribonuclease P protein component